MSIAIKANFRRIFARFEPRGVNEVPSFERYVDERRRNFSLAVDLHILETSFSISLSLGRRTMRSTAINSTLLARSRYPTGRGYVHPTL